MKSILLTVGYILFDSAIKRMLVGAGLSLAVTFGLVETINSLIDFIISNINNSPILMLNFIGISGLDVAVSMILSALLVRATIMQAHLFITRG